MIGMVCCKTKEPLASQNDKTPINLPAPVIVYKTYKDFSQYVPVMLSEDKTTLISYPDKRDIANNRSFPDSLKQGYLLDNIGIGKNTAYLIFTIQDYSQMTIYPTPETLMKSILETNPFTEMYLCNCQKDTIIINSMIEKGISKFCTLLK